MSRYTPVRQQAMVDWLFRTIVDLYNLPNDTILRQVRLTDRGSIAHARWACAWALHVALGLPYKVVAAAMGYSHPHSVSRVMTIYQDALDEGTIPGLVDRHLKLVVALRDYVVPTETFFYSFSQLDFPFAVESSAPGF